jgi:hypothetical protein
MTLVTRMFALLAVAAWVPVVIGIIGRTGPFRRGKDNEAGSVPAAEPPEGLILSPLEADDFAMEHQEPEISDLNYTSFEDEPLEPGVSRPSWQE